MFYFVVRHLRWVAKIPGLPQFFDALLLACTWLFRRERLAAMEALEKEALRLPGVGLKFTSWEAQSSFGRGANLAICTATAYWMSPLAARPRKDYWLQVVSARTMYFPVRSGLASNCSRKRM